MIAHNKQKKRLFFLQSSNLFSQISDFFAYLVALQVLLFISNVLNFVIKKRNSVRPKKITGKSERSFMHAESQI